MDIGRLREAEYQLTHRHSDGSWAEMAEEPLHHGAVEHDPERGWSLGRLFRCRTCEESVLVVPAMPMGTRSGPSSERRARG